MRAIDLAAHMRQVGTWVDWGQTVDTFKAGDPQTEVRGIAVSWMSSLAALREAIRRECNLFVTHEPTFYAHREDDPDVGGDANYQEKRKLLEESGLVVYRCHDVWDRMPQFGIRDSWVRGLGYEGRPFVEDEHHWFRVVDIGETTLGTLAGEVASKLAPLGQPGVQMIGHAGQPVRRLGLGIGATGGIQAFRLFRALGADACIATEVTYWREIRWALDLGMSVLVCEHAVSELWGIEELAHYIARLFPSIPVVHIPTPCAYQIVAAS
ncbi:MAG: Nif3-like dinuclear metal center hexameric protein [Anaerolineae bacterium]|nr:Nif3-like dinuclear metal center hexameric protein [Anaerolineae bacterium]